MPRLNHSLGTPTSEIQGVVISKPEPQLNFTTASKYKYVHGREGSGNYFVYQVSCGVW